MLWGLYLWKSSETEAHGSSRKEEVMTLINPTSETIEVVNVFGERYIVRVSSDGTHFEVSGSETDYEVVKFPLLPVQGDPITIWQWDEIAKFASAFNVLLSKSGGTSWTAQELLACIPHENVQDDHR